MPNLFNVPGFMLLFRESLEASIVIALLLQFVQKLYTDSVHMARMKRQIWLGAAAGALVAIIVGAVFVIVYYVVGENYFEEETEVLWEAIMMTIAVLMITLIAFKMLKADSFLEKWKAKTEAAIANYENSNESMSSKWGLFFLTFTVVVREGLESVVFVTGVSEGKPESLIIPAICGIILGIVVGYLVYRGGSVIRLSLFFKISSLWLMVIAAGLAAGAAHETEEYVYLLIRKSDPTAPEETPVIWDISDCCSHKKNYFFQILNGLVGWRSVATVATLSAYFGYWLIVGSLVVVYYKKSKRTGELQQHESSDTLNPKIVAVQA